MKNGFIFCAIISVAVLLFGGCANQDHTTAANSPNVHQGLYSPGSVGPVSGGPAGRVASKPKFNP